ncbi:replication protein, partial [Klebsiella pneumoniae]|nr:replication protein [Klebsiella pneumoniae]
LTQTGRVIGINKAVSEWSSLPVKGTEKKPYLKKVTLPESGKKSLPESGNAYYPNQVNTKDKHTKDNKDNINNPPKSPRAVSFDASAVQLPDWLSAEIWSSWVAYRRDLKKPIKSQQTVTQAINLLDRCRLNGYSPEEIINQSIANGWQGLFEPKDARPQRRQESRVTERFADKDYGKTEIPDWMRDQQ